MPEDDVITADTVLECEWCGSPCVGSVLCEPCVDMLVTAPGRKPDGSAETIRPRVIH